MFCPKCGKELPDNAVFCGNCGSQLAARASQAAPAAAGVGAYGAAPASTTQVLAGDNAITQLVPMVAAALMVIFLFLPWIKIPLLESELINSAASYLGAAGLNIKSSFSLWGIGDGIKMLTGLASYGGLSASDLATLNAMVAALKFFVIVCAALLIVGIVFAFIGRGTKFLRVVSLVMVAFAGSWIATIMYTNSLLNDAIMQGGSSALGSEAMALVFSGGNLVSVPIWPWLFLILGIVAFALADRAALAQGVEAGVAPVALGGLLAALSGVGVTGLICGIVGLRRAQAGRLPVGSSKGLSIAAIVLGALGIIGTIASVVVLQAEIFS